MNKFSVGDRVVVVSDEMAFGYWLHRRGVVAKPETGFRLSVRVMFDDGANACFHQDELEFEHVYDALSSPDSNLVSSDEADMVVSPPHYTRGKFEVIEIIEDSGVNYRLGNVLKYVLRCDHKHDDNGVQDLKKALWYLTREVEAREAQNADS